MEGQPSENPKKVVSAEFRGTHDDLLHRLVREGLPDLIEALERRGRVLPRHVLGELERFCVCGDPLEGFAHLVCSNCGHHEIVPFFCKTRGFCPCCCGRRMAERAAAWCDHVLPVVPIRQWVLTFPWRRRFLLACHPELANGVLQVVMRVIFGWYRNRGKETGLGDVQTGAVSVLQRFGSALNANFHVHSLVLDGTYGRDGRGRLRFHATVAPSQEDIEGLTATIAERVERWLERRGYPGEGELSPTGNDEDDAQLLLMAASMEGRAALGPRAGRKTRRKGIPRNPESMPRRCAAVEGYNLHADVRAGTSDRKGLERLCRYLLRPPLAKARIEEDENGDVVVGLKRAWSDGTTQIVLSRLEFLERLAALVPPPGRNTVLYHGILAAHAAGRAEVVPRPSPESKRAKATIKLVRPEVSSNESRWLPWAELLERVFSVDAFCCPRCHGRMTLRAVIVGWPATERVLEGIEKAAARAAAA